MIDAHFYVVATVVQGIGYVDCPNRSSHEFFRILMAVEGDSSVSANTLELEEVALAALLFCSRYFIIDSAAVQIAVT